MSSYLRTLQRRQARKSTDYETPDRPFRPLPDGGYEVLIPPHGWQRFSFRRLRAAQRMAQMLDHVMSTMGRPVRPRSASASINRRTGKPHKHEREIARRQRQKG